MLRCWIVALDINASVNAPVIHDIFVTNALMPWDMRPRLFTAAHLDDLSEKTGGPFRVTVKEEIKSEKVVMCTVHHFDQDQVYV